MPRIVQTEHIGAELVEESNECLALFHQVGCWEFLHVFKAHKNNIVKAFWNSFNESRAYVGNMEIKLYLEFLAVAMNFPPEG